MANPWRQAPSHLRLSNPLPQLTSSIRMLPLRQTTMRLFNHRQNRSLPTETQEPTMEAKLPDAAAAGPRRSRRRVIDCLHHAAHWRRTHEEGLRPNSRTTAARVELDTRRTAARDRALVIQQAAPYPSLRRAEATLLPHPVAALPQARTAPVARRLLRDRDSNSNRGSSSRAGTSRL